MGHNGNRIQLWDCNPGYPNMDFLMFEGSNGTIRWAAHPNKCLDVAEGSAANGNPIQLWDCNDNHPNMNFEISQDRALRRTSFLTRFRGEDENICLGLCRSCL